MKGADLRLWKCDFLLFTLVFDNSIPLPAPFIWAFSLSHLYAQADVKTKHTLICRHSGTYTFSQTCSHTFSCTWAHTHVQAQLHVGAHSLTPGKAAQMLPHSSSDPGVIRTSAAVCVEFPCDLICFHQGGVDGNVGRKGYKVI